jgi:hypothetical protein
MISQCSQVVGETLTVPCRFFLQPILLIQRHSPRALGIDEFCQLPQVNARLLPMVRGHKAVLPGVNLIAISLVTGNKCAETPPDARRGPNAFLYGSPYRC